MYGDSPVRIDAWLWAVRQFKTRSAATAACRAGHVRVNGERAKAAQSVRPGDEVRVRIDGFDRHAHRAPTLVKRVSAAVAADGGRRPHAPAAPAGVGGRPVVTARPPTKRARRDLNARGATRRACAGAEPRRGVA